ncbi:MAG: transcriptional regulator [Sulfurimonas sp.]|nr:transcriptional regulator [Sulfurimonas sp.]MBU3940298.1 TraR/DksA C4-type zinc finger protein [bacterium]MBU4025916.1 TraR/DksA C4-type zinc finger protein [bacterium]MBU4060221.1 TraR/DksA C4-type zinc finger protein [bacterium]MBU4109443.1 TraR/DksA C4-type zinc finger protein [bacterium]
MTPTQRLEIKEKIINDIVHIQKEIQVLQEKTQPIAPDCSLGLLIREEMIIAQQVYFTTLHEAQIRLNKLKFARSKIDSKEYGICLECEEEINFNRLMLLPESTHCVQCKSELGVL